MPIITEIGTSEFKTIHYICVDRFLQLSRFDYNFFGEFEANLKKNLIFYTSIEGIEVIEINLKLENHILKKLFNNLVSHISLLPFHYITKSFCFED